MEVRSGQATAGREVGASWCGSTCSGEQRLYRVARQYVIARLRGEPGAPWQRAAWDAFFRMHKRRIDDQLSRWRMPRETRRDCEQEIWLEIIRRLPQLPRDMAAPAFRVWIRRIVQSKRADCFRRRHPRDHRALSRDGGDGGNEPWEALVRGEDRALIGRGLARLAKSASESTVSVVRMHYLEGLSVGEIGERLGKSAQQVWDRRRRGVSKLRVICRKLCNGQFSR